MVKYYFIAVLIIYSFAISEQDTSKAYSQKLDKLRTELGMGKNTEFDDIAYGLLVKKLDSLKIKDHQLEDGYEWGGGKIGFDVYLKNNIDRILFSFGRAAFTPQEIKNEVASTSIESEKKIQKETKIVEEKIGPVTDLVVKKTPQKIEKKRQGKPKRKSDRKSFLSGLRIGSGFGKSLVKGASFSDYTSYFEPMLSIRAPLGIGIGPIFMSLGFESSKYSFEATADTLASYFGSGTGPILFFDLSKVIKIGGDKIGKYFMLGSASYDHGSGFVAGYDLNLFVGSLPVSFSISSRANILTLENGGNTYWVSAYAGIGIDIR